MFKDKTIGIIGAGNMGEILIKGLLQNKSIKNHRILAAESNQERREFIKKKYKIEVGAKAWEVAQKSNIIILAVKPQNVKPVLDLLTEVIDQEKLLVSIVAGVETETIAEHFNNRELRIIRVMPNAPALVHAGASALYAGRFATKDDLVLARAIFEGIGSTVVVEKEDFINIVTGLSGSGPAYLFMIIEALSDAGVQQGLSRKVANRLAAQTVFGAGKMFLETDLHAGALKDLVATPGGTTFAGLRALENGNFRAVIMDAVEAATNKSRELGKK